jgi:hypothetical protein
MSVIWPAGAGTGVGSLPGTDAREACSLVFGELPDLPHLPELPNRGAGADMIGRSAALLAELHVDLQPAGWRLVPGGAGAGRDERQAADFLRWDLDALQDAAGDYSGPLKLQAAGPWTLAASVELPKGGASLADPGAVRDLTEALAEGLAAHVAEVQRRVPGASVLVQLDEPSLPAVLAGQVPTPSGFGAIPAVEAPVLEERLGLVLSAVADAGARPGAHCCSAQPPLGLLRGSGATFLSWDVTQPVDLDAVGEAVDAGCGLILGVVPAEASAGSAVLSELGHTVEPARRMWRQLGFPPERLGEVVAVSPTCGLAGASMEYARSALRAVRAAGRRLVEEPE